MIVETDPVFKQLRIVIDLYEIGLECMPSNDVTPKGFLDLVRKSIKHIKVMSQVPMQVELLICKLYISYIDF